MTGPFPIMLFAAGLGTRMAPLTADRPKPLVQVGGRALLDHALDLTRTASVSHRIVNVHYKAEMVRAHVAGLDIGISEEDPLLDTGGGLRHALPQLGTSPVMTLNTDAIWRGPNPLDLLASAWQPQMEALLLLLPKSQVKGHIGQGDFAMDASGRIARAPQMIYAGAQIIRTESLVNMPKGPFSLNVLWDDMIARGTAYGVTYTGEWCDVGRPDAISLAEGMLDAADV